MHGPYSAEEMDVLYQQAFNDGFLHHAHPELDTPAFFYALNFMQDHGRERLERFITEFFRLRGECPDSNENDLYGLAEIITFLPEQSA